MSSLTWTQVYQMIKERVLIAKRLIDHLSVSRPSVYEPIFQQRSEILNHIISQTLKEGKKEYYIGQLIGDYSDSFTPWGLWNAWSLVETELRGLFRLQEKENGRVKQYKRVFWQSVKVLKKCPVDVLGQAFHLLVEHLTLKDIQGAMEIAKAVGAEKIGLFEPYVKPRHDPSNIYREINYSYAPEVDFGTLFAPVLILLCRNYFSPSDRRIEPLLEFLYLWILRSIDSLTLFRDSERDRMMFSSKIMPFLVQHTHPTSKMRILDLFANMGIVSSLISSIWGSECLVNDKQIITQPTTLGTVSKQLYDAYMDEKQPEDSPMIQEILKDFKSNQFSSDMPFYPTDPFYINPYDAWALSGLQKIAKIKVNFRSIDLFSEDRFLLLTDEYDIVFIDPPFGKISSYLVSEEDGLKLAKIGLDLARTQTEKKAYLLLRKPKKWKLSLDGFTKVARFQRDSFVETGLWCQD